VRWVRAGKLFLILIGSRCRGDRRLDYQQKSLQLHPKKPME